jgi:hypothetical protein
MTDDAGLAHLATGNDADVRRTLTQYGIQLNMIFNIKTPEEAVHGSTGCTSFYLCIVFCNAGMPDSPASDPSGTGIKKNADAGTGPIT